ncbi:uncharacterized protein PV09_04935 [Verruconis gallopava]|uniref:Uncharacterized protein n=1 Tax=Verruconis gallopava TaxID=253628 RepID=A0A0D1YTY9_9PEZI|nr:uncharacterized protein PV09_04935 [Verruconis gallopava]KIW04127.1 hypothetical protein PV09_04935 [Verruconis gallopava]
MAPGILLASASEQDFDQRPSKRIRSSFSPQAGECQSDDDNIPTHPLEIKPSGNAYSSHVNSKHNAGVFAALPDELTLQLLETLPATGLVALGSSCRFLYAFTQYDELWRALFVASQPADFEWLGTWRATYLKLPPNTWSKIPCPNVYSDVLHRPFFCTHTSLKKYAQNIPRQNLIARLDDLSFEEYSAKWTNQPFILTNPVKQWPAAQKWNIDYLLKHYAETLFRAEAVDWPFKKYVSYMNNSQDESPLYLFDREFVEKMNIEVGKESENAMYWPPECFGEDLFDVLGDQRPDRRWLIIGPERSGSTFHKDPNATSAWNAPLTGSKYWLMFPSGPDVPPPPGVILSEDQSEITSPLSIAEYLLSFHEIARATPGCREGICYAGEILHVPSGWFHLVLNLEESIALTQNFVPAARLTQVLRFLRDTPDHVSGFRDEVTDPYGLFVSKLQEKYPDLLEKALKQLDGKKGKWEQVKEVKQESAEGGGFSFGFDSDDEED